MTEDQKFAPLTLLPSTARMPVAPPSEIHWCSDACQRQVQGLMINIFLGVEEIVFGPAHILIEWVLSKHTL